MSDHYKEKLQKMCQLLAAATGKTQEQMAQIKAYAELHSKPVNQELNNLVAACDKAKQAFNALENNLDGEFTANVVWQQNHNETHRSSEYRL